MKFFDDPGHEAIKCNFIEVTTELPTLEVWFRVGK